MFASGCVYRMPVVRFPTSIPPIDPERLHLGDVTVVDELAPAEGVRVDDCITRDVATILKKAAWARSDDGGEAKVDVHVILENQWTLADIGKNDGLAVIFLIPIAPFI